MTNTHLGGSSTAVRDRCRTYLDSRDGIYEFRSSARYKGVEGHWRGIIRKTAVRGGSYDPTFISLDSLCQRYEGVPLAVFMAKKYPELVAH